MIMEKLRRYLESKNIPQHEFGSRIGVTQPAISRYVLGERFPEPEIILKIEKATGGYITPTDWYESLPRPVSSEGRAERQQALRKKEGVSNER